MSLKRAVALAAACGAVAIGVGMVAPAGADTGELSTETAGCSYGRWPVSVQGRPMELEAGAPAGLYLWHDTYGWHAFVTNASHTRVVFRITVTSPTKIYGVETHDESGDAVIEHADDHSVTLRATNYGYLDGMHFRTACGAGIRVSGTIDSAPLPATRVFIGHDGNHPPTFPVTIKRS